MSIYGQRRNYDGSINNGEHPGSKYINRYDITVTKKDGSTVRNVGTETNCCANCGFSPLPHWMNVCKCCYAKGER